MNGAVVILPVKEAVSAKQRLAPLLRPEERESLWWAMFEDVGEALIGARVPVAVVTNSERVAAWARRREWRVFWERAQVSESASVDAACRQLSLESCPCALRIPADVPLVQPDDIACLACGSSVEGSAVLVPSRDGTGTNALRRSPPDLFPSRFGANSFVLHAQEALRAGSNPVTVHNARLALDLDDASDVQLFMQTPSPTCTYALLAGVGIEERIAPRAQRQDLHTRR